MVPLCAFLYSPELLFVDFITPLESRSKYPLFQYAKFKSKTKQFSGLWLNRKRESSNKRGINLRSENTYKMLLSVENSRIVFCNEYPASRTHYVEQMKNFYTA
jgi:hypothetical protein